MSFALWLLVSAAPLAAAAHATEAVEKPSMMWADHSRLGRPFSKDPSVIKFKGHYLMYFSLPPYGSGHEGEPRGWAIGIAQSEDLTNWKKVGELLPGQTIDEKGLCAAGARVLEGKVHLFYQTYGNGPKDAICHAWSQDGLSFQRDRSNPVFRPSGTWTNGRAIDAEVIEWKDKLLLYCATRDPSGKVQMIAGATAHRHSDFGRAAWTSIGDGPLLQPELPWEQKCIEAPTVCIRGETLIMFYAGAYNNAPQQIGVAASKDGAVWKRLRNDPILPNGKPGSWNHSESGHPGVFVDDDGLTYLFFQGNDDNGHTWWLSRVKIGWKGNDPFVMGD